MNKRSQRTYDNITNFLYMYSARGIGHTYVAVHGIKDFVKTSNRPVFLLVRNRSNGHRILEEYNLSREDVRIIPYSELYKLRGNINPIAIDNTVMIEFLTDIQELVKDLQSTIHSYEKVFGQWVLPSKKDSEGEY